MNNLHINYNRLFENMELSRIILYLESICFVKLLLYHYYVANNTTDYSYFQLHSIPFA